MELATASVAAHCRTLTRIRNLAEVGHTSAGTSRDEFWRFVLEPIARTSRQVTIFDRYLLGGLIWHHDNLPRSRSWDPDTVIWLLEKLDRTMAGNSIVRLLTGDVRDQGLAHADDAAAMIRSLWPPRASGRISEVQVTVASWRRPGVSLPHDRHIRFDVGVGVKMHSGWDRLGRKTVRDVDGIGWQYLWRAAAVQSLRAAEGRVLSDSAAGTASVSR